MAQRSINFEWSVVEDEEVWRNLPAVTAPTAPGYERQGGRLSAQLNRSATDHRQLVRGLWMTLMCAVCLLAMTGTTFAPTDQGWEVAQTEVKAVLKLEESAWQANDEDLYNTLLDDQVAGDWRRDWRMAWGIEPAERRDLGIAVTRLEPFEDLVRVEMNVNQPYPEWWRLVPYREQRFYRPTETGWVRTLPTAAYWGQLRALETPHLRFEFYERDAGLMIALANRLELVYLQLYRLFGLEPPLNEGKLTLAVLPEPVRTGSSYGGRLRFTSPTLARVPQGLSDADHLAHQIVSRFTSRVLNQVLTESGRTNSYSWQNMFRAVRGWLRTDVLAQRSPWHQQAELVFRRLRQDYPYLHLVDVTDPYRSELPSREQDMWEYMVAESIVSYAVDTYGQEKLTTFVQGLGEYNYWSALLPRTFGVPVAEFEAGWNRYLDQTYAPIDPQRLLALQGE
jgi:hypothetical protein